MPTGSSLPENPERGRLTSPHYTDLAPILCWLAVATTLGAAAWVLILGGWQLGSANGRPPRIRPPSCEMESAGWTRQAPYGTATVAARLVPQLPLRRPGPDDLLTYAPPRPSRRRAELAADTPTPLAKSNDRRP